MPILSLVPPAAASVIPNRHRALNYRAHGKNNKVAAVRINITVLNGFGTVSLVLDCERAVRGCYASTRVGGRQSASDFIAFFLPSP